MAIQKQADINTLTQLLAGFGVGAALIHFLTPPPKRTQARWLLGGAAGAVTAFLLKDLLESAGQRPEVAIGTAIGAVSGAFVAPYVVPIEERDEFLTRALGAIVGGFGGRMISGAFSGAEKDKKETTAPSEAREQAVQRALQDQTTQRDTTADKPVKIVRQTPTGDTLSYWLHAENLLTPGESGKRKLQHAAVGAGLGIGAGYVSRAALFPRDARILGAASAFDKFLDHVAKLPQVPSQLTSTVRVVQEARPGLQVGTGMKTIGNPLVMGLIGSLVGLAWEHVTAPPTVVLEPPAQ